MMLRKTKPLSFYFVRHGQTELNNQNKCCGGGSDVPLNKTGREQALMLRDRMKDYRFFNVISSPMMRARETAHILSEGNFIVDEGLCEWRIGIYEKVDLDQFLPYIKELPDETLIPEGESKREFFKRVMQPLYNIIEKHENNFLIVAHGGVYWAILDAFKLPYDHLENCQLARFSLENESWSKEIIV